MKKVLMLLLSMFITLNVSHMVCAAELENLTAGTYNSNGWTALAGNIGLATSYTSDSINLGKYDSLYAAASATSGAYGGNCFPTSISGSTLTVYSTNDSVLKGPINLSSSPGRIDISDLSGSGYIVIRVPQYSSYDHGKPSYFERAIYLKGEIALPDNTVLFGNTSSVSAAGQTISSVIIKPWRTTSSYHASGYNPASSEIAKFTVHRDLIDTYKSSVYVNIEGSNDGTTWTSELFKSLSNDDEFQITPASTKSIYRYYKVIIRTPAGSTYVPDLKIYVTVDVINTDPAWNNDVATGEFNIIHSRDGGWVPASTRKSGQFYTSTYYRMYDTDFYSRAVDLTDVNLITIHGAADYSTTHSDPRYATFTGTLVDLKTGNEINMGTIQTDNDSSDEELLNYNTESLSGPYQLICSVTNPWYNSSKVRFDLHKKSLQTPYLQALTGLTTVNIPAPLPHSVHISVIPLLPQRYFFIPTLYSVFNVQAFIY